MFLRQLRWITAALAVVAAVAAAPGRAKADVQILVEELNNGSVVGSMTTTLTGSGTTTFNGTAFTNVLVTVSTNSASSGLVASLTPSFSGQLTNAFSPTASTLRVTVSDNGFSAVGPTGTFKVQTSGSNGFASGTQAVASTTRIFTPGSNSTVAGPVELSTPDGTLVTNGAGLPVSGLPSPYGIQQTILVSYSGPVTPNATFGATGGASVTSTAAVPAPAGLVLALAALPVIGLRRTLRKRAAV